MKKYTLLYSLFLLIALLCSNKIQAQGVMAPGGTGAWGNMIYVTGGISLPSPYIEMNVKEINTLRKLARVTDTGINFGFGIGNPKKNVGVQFGSNMLDVSQHDLFDLGLKIHRYIGAGISTAIGVENVLLFDTEGNFEHNISFSKDYESMTSGASTFYLAFTHDLAYLYPDESAASRFSYSIGAGTGRFAELSVKDLAPIEAGGGGKTGTGTYAFAATKVRLTNYSNFHLEWTGKNLNTGFSVGWHIGPIPFSALAIVADLTPYSGSGPRVVLAGSMGFNFTKYDGNNESKKEKKRNRNMNLIVENNEISALSENLKKQTEAIYESNVALEDKIAHLQDEIEIIKDKHETEIKEIETRNNASDNYNNDTDNNGTREINDAVVFRDPDSEKFGYHVEPGNYVVIHALQKKENVIHTLNRLEKIGLKANVAYNSDKEIHYIYLESFPPEEINSALQRSTELRQKGFENAWVYINKHSDSRKYFKPIEVEELLDLSNDKIVKVTTGDDSNYPIDKGTYVILESVLRRDKAMEEADKLIGEGIDAKVMYNHDREKHYLYTEQLAEEDESTAINISKGMKDQFQNSWVLKYTEPSSALVEEVPQEEAKNVTNLKGNDIRFVDMQTEQELDYSLNPGCYVVLGAFSTVANAKRNVKTYNEKGTNCKIALNKDKKMYYIYAAMYSSVNEAIEQKNNLKSSFPGAWVFMY